MQILSHIQVLASSDNYEVFDAGSMTNGPKFFAQPSGVVVDVLGNDGESSPAVASGASYSPIEMHRYSLMR